MTKFSSFNSVDVKEEEKRLYEEYKQKVAALKKVQKENEAVGQIFTKGLLPIYILHILNDSPATGNDIAKKIGEKTNGLWLPSTGGIYPLLKKLEKEDYIIGKWDDPKKKFQKILKTRAWGKSFASLFMPGAGKKIPENTLYNHEIYDTMKSGIIA